MPRWRKGSAIVERLLESNELDSIIVDPESVTNLLESARRHLDTAETVKVSDPELAIAAAYTATRKAATALLWHQGLRPKIKGGHTVIIEVMNAQFPGVPGLKSIGRLRRQRNEADYPNPSSYPEITTTEIDDAIIVGSQCIDSAEKLLAQTALGLF